ncbi:helix-turn-helix domain-containing protein [Curtobacterium flaccumfaciens]
MEGRSVRSVAAVAGLHHATLDKILAGRAWPDLATIGRLQIALGVQFLRL